MKKLVSSLLVCILIALATAPLAAAKPAKPSAEPPSWKSMDKELLAKLLEKSELAAVDAFGPDKIEMCSVGILANAPPEKVWKAITDFEGYGKLMPDFTTPEVLERSNKTAVVHFTVTVLKLSLLNISTDYTLRYTFDKPRRADISWVSGKVKNISGYWELFPVAGGKKTVVIYAITSDLASANALVGEALKEQPATVMAINLSSAIVLTRLIVKKAEKL
jgi:ribosome-associated toxin RatA of RatAB toxin-antitoxin module